MQERFCSIHGPYDAIYSTCPYCSGSYKRPLPPKALEADDTRSVAGGALGGAQGEAAGEAEGGAKGVEQPRAWAMPEEAVTQVEVPAPPPSSPRRFLDDDEQASPTKEEEVDVTQLDIASTGLQGIFWVKEGSQRGRVYKIADGTIIGRRSGNLIVNDPKVSNPHAKITVEDEQFLLWDFGSKNGCYINGERIRAATALKENDLIRIGDTIFILKVL